MKKITLSVTILMLISAMLFTGCNVIFTNSEDGGKGSGNLETRQYDFSDFTKVEISSAFDYEIERSNTYSISITADDNMFEHIEVTKQGDTLEIDLKPFLNFGTVTLEATITMPELHGLDSSGATRGTITGFNSSDDLDLNVSGASKVNFSNITTGDVKGDISGASKLEGEITTGNIDLIVSGASDIDFKITSHDLKLNASGASKVNLDGSGNDILVDTSGASRINLGNYSANDADISMSGASTCDINVNGRIDVDLSGASRLEYTGQPVLGSISLSGGAQVKDKNEN